MPRITVAVGVVTLATLLNAQAMAQDAAANTSEGVEEGAIVLSSIRVQEEGEAPQSYRLDDPIDSGSSTFSRESIEARAPGSGDVNQILKALPTVQFSSEEGRATRANLQDLRPSQISISGGKTTENLFLLDGVSVNSRVDTSSTNANHFIEGNAAASPQSVWIDSSLLGAITLRDSNISARYGEFTGGVVEVETRRPSREWGISAHYGETRPGLAQFRMSDVAKKSFEEGEAPGQPEYLKRRLGASMDIPVAQSIRFLLGYSRSLSRVEYERGTYVAQHGNYWQRSLSQNMMGKVEIDLEDDLRLTGQVSYSPYESEFSHANGIDNWVYLDGGGGAGSLKLEGRAGADAKWIVTASYAQSDTDRRVDRPGSINVHVSAPGGIVDWCSSGSICSLGAPNPINQRQEDYVAKGEWEQPAFGGELRLGAEYSRVDASKARPETSNSYRHIATSGRDSTLDIEVSPDTICVEPVSAEGICVDGSYALAQWMPEFAFESRVKLDAASLWGEWQGRLAGFELRTGLRYDYESFLGNHVVAPRVALSHNLPFADAKLTLGANRYYGRSFLGYALRENYPDSYIYRRMPEVIDGKNYWSEDWTLYSHTFLPKYSNADLDTPYTDELTAALIGSFLGGEYRLKGILRESRRQFARSEQISYPGEEETGETGTIRESFITNDGESSYRGLSLEYVRSFGDHSISASTNLSKTKSNNIDYFDETDELLYAGDMVYYEGEVVPLLEATASNQLEDYASPLIVNLDWAAHWLNGRLRTNVNGRYRSGFKRIDDTGENIELGGTRYDIYDLVEYSAAISVNLAASLDVLDTRYGALTLDLRVNNLFNTVLEKQFTSSSQPWQIGRNLWLSANYTF